MTDTVIQVQENTRPNQPYVSNIIEDYSPVLDRDESTDAVNVVENEKAEVKLDAPTAVTQVETVTDPGDAETGAKGEEKPSDEATVKTRKSTPKPPKESDDGR